MVLSHLSRALFHLDPAGSDWVRRMHDGLGLRDRVAQLFVLIAAIDAGVLSIMSAHIALPAFVRQQDSAARVEVSAPPRSVMP